MSVPDQAAVAVLSQLALAADGAVLGVALAYVALRTLNKFNATSSALNRISQTPSLRVSDLRSLLSSSEGDDTSDQSEAEKLVIVRSTVEAKSVVDGNWKSLRPPNVLVSHESGEKCVVLLRTQTCIYNEWRGFLGWTFDLRSLFARPRKKQESSSLRTVPFVLADDGRGPESDYAIVNLDGSRHPIPLTTVFHQLQPVNASPYTFLQAFFGHEYPVALLDEEKILPIGKDITAVGICSLKSGIPEIRSCKDLPYFLSDMTKDQMVIELAFRTKALFWGGIALSAISIGILGYAVARNWNRWKSWRQQRRIRQQNHIVSDDSESQVVEEEETGDVPDGQLCVVCLTRRKQSVFVPCGHLVCCQRCALSVEQRELSPKCPVCRQAIQGSVRIYDS